jgi:hypothetical protein
LKLVRGTGKTLAGRLVAVTGNPPGTAFIDTERSRIGIYFPVGRRFT